MGDLSSIPGRIIPKTQKMVLDTSLLHTQQYKVRINGKVEQCRERSSDVEAIEKGAFWPPSTTGTNFIYLLTKNGIWHFKMCHVNKEKYEKRRCGRNRTTQLRMNYDVWRKRKLQVL